MLQNLAWQATDDLVRAQLVLFHALGDQIGLMQQDRRRALGLSHAAWSAWAEFLANGSLPAEPPLPEMLLRVGSAAFRLSDDAQQRPI